MFIHHVYFWLAPDAPASAKDQLLQDCKTLLSQIPGIVHLWAGPPAMTPREVVDNSYAVRARRPSCEGKSDHDVYQPHPLHQQFIARNKQHWTRVQIYDFRGMNRPVRQLDTL